MIVRRCNPSMGVGRATAIRLDGEGERFEELCGQCWKGKLCVTNGGDVFPCVFSRATRLGDVKSGLLAILQTARLTEFRNKVRALEARGSRFSLIRPFRERKPKWTRLSA
jgi:MoaA/NifB/PqqE/SkfB family radical SAM enzyme